MEDFNPNLGWWAALMLLCGALWRAFSVGQRMGEVETKLDRAVTDIGTLQADVKEILSRLR